MVSSTSDPRPWLLQAVEEHPGLSDQRYREAEPDAVLPGDICVVGPFDPAASVDHRLGMVGHLFVVIDETGDEGWAPGCSREPRQNWPPRWIQSSNPNVPDSAMR